MRRAIATVLACELLASAPATHAAIGMPVSLGTGGSATTVSAGDVISGINANAGEPIVIILQTDTNAFGPISCHDSVNMTYAVASQWAASIGKLDIFYIANPSAVSAGKITCSWSGMAKYAVTAIQIPGLDTSSPLDKALASGVNGSGNSISGLSTGTLAFDDEIVVGIVGLNGAPGGWTESNGFASLTAATTGGSMEVHPAYEIVSSTTSVSYAPSWPTNKGNAGTLITLKAPGSTIPRGTLLGVLP